MRQQFTAHKTPDFVSSPVALDLQHGEFSRGPEGLYDYGCLATKVLQGNSFLRLSEEQFHNLIRRLPYFLQALTGNGSVWDLRTSTLTYAPCPEEVEGNEARHWRFRC